ncbi:MAG: AAA family ATPase [Acidobacteria bacterium]|nr:AAA family ATPase [Acidobacteriota bacterium]
MTSASVNKSAKSWNALLISPNRDLVTELTPILLERLPLVPVIDLGVYPPLRTLKEIASSHSPELCFLDVTSDRERAFAVITELTALRPGIQIVAMIGEKDPDLILRCLRQGSSEFLIRPFSVDQVEPTLDRLAKLNGGGESSTPAARIICVMPAKGACGASTIACNLAHQWKRFGGKRILLADLDPLTGTVSFLLKIKSNYSFIDVLARGTNLDADLWKGMVTPSGGVDVMLSPESPVDGINDLHDSSAIIEYSRSNYDAVIVDTSGAYGEWSLTLAGSCDDLLLVTTNELPALQAAQRTLAYLERNRVERAKIKLLINRYNREVGLNKEMIETALHSEVFQLLPSDYEAVQRALMEGKPVPSTSGFGKSLTALADRLNGKREEPSAAKKPNGILGLFSFLNR